ncbi:MAG TPA: (E)-4-hydroxy-3-methylbut-2-enyl-diphosphate synthase, partial [Opitutaceae bacterium]|nr:(E)-4-hydroxy-3-methylbut-2-enyl-diphosphate synthase [Opitutaceae bacterium]
MAYCASRFRTVRRPTVAVKVGMVGVGGANPIRLQSMTTSDTQDIDATVKQSIALAEVGCEIVRITAPNVPAAQCLRPIRERFTAAGFGHVPLVADIHFLPQAAMEAVEHVEKVRVNPGNYADKKRFATREYTDAEYARELQRLHDAFSPLVRRCRELGRALRIGTNHGSLSDRIMNRYGDTPLGMVESALEFVRIAESEGFHDIILSMKASNPKVMIQAYRLLVERLDAAHRPYPLHLGVTEAGDGEDGRIKGAMGIGTLLLDGLGDTIRVSLTEDSVYEIPVARA